MIKAGSFDLDYFDVGSGSSVILVHSSASGNRQWNRLADSLRDRHRVIAPNLFGYGATTSWPATHRQTLEDQAEFVVATASLVPGPVILIGHSLGGAVALEAAIRLGDRLRALIVFEPILFSLLRAKGVTDVFDEIADIAARYRDEAANGRWDAVAELFVDYWSGSGTWAAMPDERKAGLRKMLPNVVHEWDAVISPGRALSEWGTIQAPTHVVRAADTRRSTHAVATLLAEAHHHWRLHEIPAGGHMAPVSRPDTINPLFADLLARHSSGADGTRSA